MITVRKRKKNSIDIRIADKRFWRNHLVLVFIPSGALVSRRVIQ